MIRRSHIIPTVLVFACLVASAPAATITVGYDASALSDTAVGGLATWAPSTNTTGLGFDWDTGTATKSSGSTNLQNVNDWVENANFKLETADGDDSFHGKVGSGTQNTSWEMVFSPGDFTGNHALFNTGGDGRGTAIVLQGSIVEFRFQDMPNAAESVRVSFDLSTIGSATDFYHIIGVMDLQGGAGDPAVGTLYVNGGNKQQVTSTGDIGDGDGGDVAGLGLNNNIPSAGDATVYGDAFTGDIAIFNFYQNQLLGDSDASANYAALVPEPTCLALSLLGIIGLAVFNGRRH